VVSKRAAAAGGAAAVVAVVGALLLVPRAHAAPSLASLAVAVSQSSLSVNQEADVTVTAYDAAGDPLAGVVPDLLENGSQVEAFPATDSMGSSTLTFSFRAAGNYSLGAQSGSVTATPTEVVVGGTGGGGGGINPDAPYVLTWTDVEGDEHTLTGTYSELVVAYDNLSPSLHPSLTPA
jgi:hypothetical protein